MSYIDDTIHTATLATEDVINKSQDLLSRLEEIESERDMEFDAKKSVADYMISELDQMLDIVNKAQEKWNNVLSADS